MPEALFVYGIFPLFREYLGFLGGHCGGLGMRQHPSFQGLALALGKLLPQKAGFRV